MVKSLSKDKIKFNDIEQVLEYESSFWIQTKKNSIKLSLSLDRTYMIDANENHVNELPETSDILVIMGHGEGSHILFNKSVLCSAQLTDKDKKKCSTQSRCKRSINNNLEFNFLSNISGKVIIFLSCNSFSLAGETYPNPSNLVQTAKENFDIVIGTHWALEYDSTSLKKAALAVLSSKNGIEIINTLNTLFGNQITQKPFCGVGNKSVIIDSINFKLNKYFFEKKNKCFFSLSSLNSINNSFFLCHSGILFIDEKEINEKEINKIPSFELDQVENTIYFLNKNLKTLTKVFSEQIIGLVSDSVKCQLSDIKTYLNSLNHKMIKCKSFNVFDEKTIQDISFVKKKIKIIYISIVNQILKSFKTQNIVGDSFDSITYQHSFETIRLTKGRKCNTCHNNELIKTESSYLINQKQITIECPICGVKSHRIEDQKILQLNIESTNDTLTVSTKWMNSNWGFKILEFRDKGNAKNNFLKCYLKSSEVSICKNTYELSLDQISIRAIELSENGWQYQRRVFHNV